MQMIEILDNQSGAGRQLLKSRHLARAASILRDRGAARRNHATALRFISL